MLKILVIFVVGKVSTMNTPQCDTGQVAVSGKKDILNRLVREILPLQGIKTFAATERIYTGIPSIDQCFPGAAFPTGCIHEFLSAGPEDIAATRGFAAGLISRVASQRGIVLWIGSTASVFPPALKTFGMEPHNVIFINPANTKDLLWTMEEALKCEKLSVVVGEFKEIGFKESRRLQLAVEQSRVTGLLLRHQPRFLNTVASVSRWRITSLPGELEEGLPGVGFPRWQVELLKVRNGRTGIWELQWTPGGWTYLQKNIFSITHEQRRKTG